MKAFNPFADAEIAKSYEAWYHTKGLSAAVQEKALLEWLVEQYPGAESVLEVGCGTGYFLRWFHSLGLDVAGIDRSIQMIREAKNVNGREYILGDAIQLPVAAKSFDLVAFITTLEFLSNPVFVLKEALRVARKGIILGVINENSRLGKRYLHSGGPIWGKAKLYNPTGLRRLVEEAVGKREKIIYRTTLWPHWHGALPLPWGGFTGMGVILLSAGEEA